MIAFVDIRRNTPSDIDSGYDESVGESPASRVPLRVIWGGGFFAVSDHRVLGLLFGEPIAQAFVIAG